MIIGYIGDFINSSWRQRWICTSIKVKVNKNQRPTNRHCPHLKRITCETMSVLRVKLHGGIFGVPLTGKRTQQLDGKMRWTEHDMFGWSELLANAAFELHRTCSLGFTMRVVLCCFWVRTCYICLKPESVHNMDPLGAMIVHQRWTGVLWFSIESKELRVWICPWWYSTY